MDKFEPYLNKRFNKTFKCPACGKRAGHFGDNPVFPKRMWFVKCHNCRLRTPDCYTAEEALYYWRQFRRAFNRKGPSDTYWLLEQFKHKLEDYRGGDNGDYSLNYINIRHSLIDYFIASDIHNMASKFAPLFTQYKPDKENPYKVYRVSDDGDFGKEDSDFLIDGVLRILEENKHEIPGYMSGENQREDH